MPDDRFAYRDDREARNAARAKALEELLIRKGVITSNTIDAVLGYFETRMGPFNGARIVARAWVDPSFKRRLIENTPAAIAELDLPAGMAGAEGEHMRAVANAPGIHTSSSARCAPAIHGRFSGCRPTGTRIRPSAAGRVREPRAVLQEFGLAVPDFVGNPHLGFERAGPMVRGAGAPRRLGAYDGD